MIKKSEPFLAAEIIAKRYPNFTPKVGVVLGSGLGPVAEQIENPVTISYADLPGLGGCGVEGHAGNEKRGQQQHQQAVADRPVDDGGDHGLIPATAANRCDSCPRRPCPA